MNQHFYSDGKWSTPWMCRECHPLWYCSSAVIPAILLFLLLVFAGR